MSVDASLVKRIANLSAIALDEREIPLLKKEFESILALVNVLTELDAGETGPIASVNVTELRLRDDVVTEGFIAEKILANAPQSDAGLFIVPKVIEE